MRLNKFISRFSNHSRREADKLIANGDVSINGKEVITEVAFVGSGDCILIKDHSLLEYDKLIYNPELHSNSNSLQKFKIKLWLYHKKIGTITSYRDQFGRPTIFESLPSNLPRVISVGRLDFNTEGLILLTNYGPLARVLELPQNGFIRVYRCRYHGKISDIQIKDAARGLSIQGVNYAGAVIIRDDCNKQIYTKTNSWLTIKLCEGKNREIRNIMRYFGVEVTRLIRTGFDGFKLGSLLPGSISEVPTVHIAKYLHMLPSKDQIF